MPYEVSVKDRMMYSHTFTFGDGVPFTTGCTSVVTATLEGNTLGPYDILIDICVAQELLSEVMAMYNHQNLDTVPEFNTPARRNTTVEVMAHAVFNQLMARLTKFHAETSVTDGKGLGNVTGLHIKLEETDVASASYFESNPGSCHPAVLRVQ